MAAHVPGPRDPFSQGPEGTIASEKSDGVIHWKLCCALGCAHINVLAPNHTSNSTLLTAGNMVRGAARFFPQSLSPPLPPPSK